MAELQILPLTFEGKWRGGPMQVEWDGIPITYAVRHEPTRTIYFGSSGSAAVAFYSWYQRLRGINTQPHLSPSLRAVYTKRNDFVFIVLRTWEKGTLAHDAADLALKHIKTLRSKRPEKLLNMDSKGKEREYWLALTLFEDMPSQDNDIGRYPEG